MLLALAAGTVMVAACMLLAGDVHLPFIYCILYFTRACELRSVVSSVVRGARAERGLVWVLTAVSPVCLRMPCPR